MDALIAFKEIYGTSNTFIANKANVSSSLVGKFVRDDIVVSDDKLAQIQAFMEDRGFEIE